MAVGKQGRFDPIRAFALALSIAVLLSGMLAVACLPGTAVAGDGTPHALFGFVYDPYGDLIDFVATVTLTNNRTGETMTVDTDPLATDYSYRLDDISNFALNGDRLALNVSFSGAAGVNWTTVDTSYPYQRCHIRTSQAPIGWDVPVSAGWNLISNPLYRADTSVEDVLSDLDGGYDLVQTFVNGRWVQYDARSPAFLNTLTTIEQARGYWLHVTDPMDGNLTFTGLPPKETDIRLDKGWNLVGYPSTQPEMLSLSLVGVPWDVAQGYSGSALYHLRYLAPSEYFHPGGGYWLHLTSGATWTVYGSPGYGNEPAAFSPQSSDNVSGFSNGFSSVVCCQVSPGTVDRGQVNVPMLNLSVTNTGGFADTLDRVNVTGGNSNDSDVTEVSLWMDADADNRVGGGDVLLGTAAFNGSRAELAVSYPVLSGETVRFLVTYNISFQATLGNRVDASVAAGDMRMVLAGWNLLELNPAGDANVTASLYTPHALYGRTYDVGGAALPNASVRITNQRTGQFLLTASDASGRYSADLGELPSGYEIGDTMAVLVNDTAMRFGLNQTVVTDSFGNECDVRLEDGPYLFDEYPTHLSTIYVSQPEMRINITDNGSGVDPGSIVFNVKGTDYVVDGTVLTWDGATLAFNSTAANVTFIDGENVWVNVSSAKDLAGNAAVNTPYVWSFRVVLAVVEDRPFIRLHKEGFDVNITWDPVVNASSYVIYRCSGYDGTGFNFSAPLAEVTSLHYVDANALLTKENYSYVIRAKSPVGEGPASNIGWKFRKLLVKNNLTSSINWLALPYETDLKYAQDLIDDLGGSANVNYISRWLVSTQSYQNKPPVGGFNWPITPGEGILVNMKSTMVYTIVGSYNSSVTVDLVKNNLTSSINWLALPYHTTFVTAQDVITDLGGSSTLNYLSRWLVPTQSYQNKPPVGGFDWPVTPGEAILVNMKLTITDYNLGPAQNP